MGLGGAIAPAAMSDGIFLSDPLATGPKCVEDLSYSELVSRLLSVFSYVECQGHVCPRQMATHVTRVSSME